MSTNEVNLNTSAANSPVANLQAGVVENIGTPSLTISSPSLGALDPSKLVTNSPSVVTTRLVNDALRVNGLITEATQSREIPTVYLPPIQYKYDNATGKLIQISGSEANHLTGNVVPSNQVLFSSPNKAHVSYTTPRLGHSDLNNISQLPTSFHYPSHIPQAYNTSVLLPPQHYQSPQTQQPYVFDEISGHLRPNTSNGTFNPARNTFNDTPSLEYEAALQQYNERKGNGIGGGNISRAFLNFENTATKIFRKPDNYSVSDLGNAALNILHPSSANYMKAAVFKLERLEGVPINPAHASKTSFNIVAYFDTNTENYDIHKSSLQCAALSDKVGFSNCELRGEVVRIPWNGEEFVYLKVVQHVGTSKSVVGRLQLKLSSLVTGHPLRIPIIGDDGYNKGNAILEYSTGSVNLHEARKFADESVRNAMFRQKYEQRSRCNRMPEYDAMIEEHNRFEKKSYEFNPYNTSPYKSTGNHRNQIPAAIDHFVRWCCDITDHDLY